MTLTLPSPSLQGAAASYPGRCPAARTGTCGVKGRAQPGPPLRSTLQGRPLAFRTHISQLGQAPARVAFGLLCHKSVWLPPEEGGLGLQTTQAPKQPRQLGHPASPVSYGGPGPIQMLMRLSGLSPCVNGGSSGLQTAIVARQDPVQEIHGSVS